MKRHRSKTSGVKAEKEEKPPVVKEEKTDVEGRPPVMAKGSATVYYLHGKLHRNESSQCFRAFPEASGRHDRKYPFKNQAVEVAWEKALTYLEEHAKERAEAHANAVDVSWSMWQSLRTISWLNWNFLMLTFHVTFDILHIVFMLIGMTCILKSMARAHDQTMYNIENWTRTHSFAGRGANKKTLSYRRVDDLKYRDQHVMTKGFHSGWFNAQCNKQGIYWFACCVRWSSEKVWSTSFHFRTFQG